MSVTTISEQRRAGSPVLAPAPVAARKCGLARLAPEDAPVLALLGAKASEPFNLALTHATILARPPFASADDCAAESTLREGKVSVSPLKTRWRKQPLGVEQDLKATTFT